MVAAILAALHLSAGQGKLTRCRWMAGLKYISSAVSFARISIECSAMK